MRALLAVVLWVGLGLACPASAQLAFYDAAWPQEQSNTCQSYALAYALARAGAPGFELRPDRLRSAERSVREAIKSIGGDTSLWTTWQRAVCKLTSNVYSLKIKKDLPDALSAIEEAGRLAGEWTSQVTPSLAELAAKTPALISVRSVEGATYSPSHIVVVLGAGRGARSPKPLLLLNSAVKVANRAFTMCTADGFGDGEKDMQWSAGVSWVTRYTLNPAHHWVGHVVRERCP